MDTLTAFLTGVVEILSSSLMTADDCRICFCVSQGCDEIIMGVSICLFFK